MNWICRAIRKWKLRRYRRALEIINIKAGIVR